MSSPTPGVCHHRSAFRGFASRWLNGVAEAAWRVHTPEASGVFTPQRCLPGEPRCSSETASSFQRPQGRLLPPQSVTFSVRLFLVSLPFSAVASLAPVPSANRMTASVS